MGKPELIAEIVAEGGSIKFFKDKKLKKDIFFLITNEDYFNNEDDESTESGLYDRLSDLLKETLELYPVFMLNPIYINKEYKKELFSCLSEYSLSRGINLDAWCGVLK